MVALTNVFFYDVQADGFSLDDKREPVEENDLPDCLNRWCAHDQQMNSDRSDKAFFVSKEEIRKANYDLSFNCYREIVYIESVYDSPQVILERMGNLNSEIASDLAKLEETLG